MAWIPVSASGCWCCSSLHPPISPPFSFQDLGISHHLNLKVTVASPGLPTLDCTSLFLLGFGLKCLRGLERVASRVWAFRECLKMSFKVGNFFFFNFFLAVLGLRCVAARTLSLVAASGDYSLLRCAGFSLRWLLLLRSVGSRCAGFSSCGSQA